MKKKLDVEAVIENLPKVLDFIDRNLEELECGMKAQTQIDISVEELFVNIANYAYPEGVGKAEITFEFDAESSRVSISLIDSGIPFNPLSKPDPDISLSAEERQIGGLGIYMVKKYMDELLYAFVDDQNIITLKKNI
ncbi:MAG: ATP-binding protein [Treponemataceae bacterium]|nr:ATP-binding protein [Treponemataceae bacterium]